MARRVVGFGASTMQGVGDPEGGFLRRIAEEMRSGEPGTEFINAGVGGDTTRDMLGRLAGVVAANPFEAIVLLGCNDLPRDGDGAPQNRVSLDEYRENLQRILAGLKGERALFVSSFLPSPDRTGLSAETFENYMAAAVSLARAEGYEVWDLFAETRGRGAEFLADDGLHYNAAGHAFIAERVGGWIRGGQVSS